VTASSSATSTDRTLAIVGGASGAVSIAALLARWADVLPAGPAALIMLIGVGVGLKAALSYAAKSASSVARTRVMTLVSTVALAISVVTLIGTLPRITQTAGMEPFMTDLLAELWTLAVLTVVAGPVRTLGWRAFVGAGLTGFLGITALAGLVGRPVVAQLGSASLLAVALWVPVTEEILKVLPVVLVVVLALRRSSVRPSALDLMLLGAWTGAGFALYENATYGRGSFSMSANPLSLFFPIETHGVVEGLTVAGHLVYTALIALGIGVSLLYKRRLRQAWVVAIAAIAAVLTEHVAINALAADSLNGVVAEAVEVLTLGGQLTTLLLIAGMAYVLLIETRSVGRAFQPSEWIRLLPAEATRRSSLLATAQGQPAVAVAPLSQPRAT
jgi:RsiW-degrading membrane proteinase PrsW (M82 family)